MRKLDLTGQRFGALTVLRPAEDIGDCTAWVCRCDCGQETIVRTVHLWSGRTKSCGCQRRTTVIEMIKARENNVGGVSGVEWQSHKQRWKATICFNRKRYYLGEYPDFEDAANARKRAEEARVQAEEYLHDSFLRELANEQVQSAGG